MWLGAPFFKREKNVPQRQSGMWGGSDRCSRKGASRHPPRAPWCELGFQGGAQKQHPPRPAFRASSARVSLQVFTARV